MRGLSPAVRLAAGVAVAIACLGVLMLSTTPNLTFVNHPVADHVARKLGHFLAFLAIAFGAGITAGASLARMRTAWLIVSTAAALALLDEGIQSHVPGRLSSPIDVAVDVFGAICGVVAWLRFERLPRER